MHPARVCPVVCHWDRVAIPCVHSLRCYVFFQEVSSIHLRKAATAVRYAHKGRSFGIVLFVHVNTFRTTGNEAVRGDASLLHTRAHEMRKIMRVVRVVVERGRSPCKIARPHYMGQITRTCSAPRDTLVPRGLCTNTRLIIVAKFDCGNFLGFY